MTWRSYLLLSLLGLTVSLGVAQLQPYPGYLDSDYYYSGGIQLSRGMGFNEPYLWNYLDDPQRLPHPSHTYWMPLSSLIAALGLKLTGQETYASGRLGFILISALVPAVTAALAYSFSHRRELAVTSGLLGVFSIFHVPFMPVPDNFGPFMLLGGIYLLVCSSRRPQAYFALGMLSGLLALARSDGMLWIGLTCLLVLWRFLEDRKVGAALAGLLFVLMGFLMVMGPWFWRNYRLFGTVLAPGGSHLIWLKSYEETFVFPAGQLTRSAWLAQGWAAILNVRWKAFGINIENAFAAQAGIFLFPFILLGLWQNRSDDRIRLGALAWIALLGVMTVIFPFAGARGGFFHAGAAVQPLWWTLAPIGLEIAVGRARRRNWFTPGAFRIFRAALVGIAILMSGIIVYIRIIQPGWGEGESRYPRLEAFLEQNGMQPDDVVIVRNPPGYYLMTGRAAVVVPYGDEATVLEVARRFHARFVILEQAGAVGPIRAIYDNLASQPLRYLGEVDGTRLFEVRP